VEGWFKAVDFLDTSLLRYELGSRGLEMKESLEMAVEGGGKKGIRL
jgi:hypothetical protein